MNNSWLTDDLKALIIKPKYLIGKLVKIMIPYSSKIVYSSVKSIFIKYDGSNESTICYMLNEFDFIIQESDIICGLAEEE